MEHIVRERYDVYAMWQLGAWHQTYAYKTLDYARLKAQFVSGRDFCPVKVVNVKTKQVAEVWEDGFKVYPEE